jgi:hypothetical protein
MARSSRSHSMQVPADSMMASSPQVIVPSRRQAMIGMVPAGPRAAWSGRRWPMHWSSMPPVPKVALACPGRVHPWPMSEACWSPAIPAMSGRPVRARADPDRPRRVDDGGHHRARGCAAPRAPRSLHPDPSAADEPVTPALVASVTWRSPPTASTPPRCRPCRRHSSPRSAGTGPDRPSSRSAATLVADALGAIRIPWAWSSRQVPTVRRSCQPSRGPTGHPGGAVPHDGRRPLVGDPHRLDRPSLGQRRRGHLHHRVGHGHRVELDQPGERGCREHRHVVDVLDGAVGRTTAPRTPEVPTSTTRMLTARAPPRTGLASPSLPGLRMPSRIERLLDRRQHAETPPRASARNRPRLSPMPWWWLMAPPAPWWPLVTSSQARR